MNVCVRCDPLQKCLVYYTIAIVEDGLEVGFEPKSAIILDRVTPLCYPHMSARLQIDLN